VQISKTERLTLMSLSMKNLFLAVFALLATGVYAQSQPACCQKSGSAAPSCSSSAAKTEASCHDKSAPADKAKVGKAKKSAAKSSKKGDVAVIERRIEIKDGQTEPNLADLLRDLPVLPQGGETRMFFFDSSDPEGLTPGWSASSSKARLGVVGVENATDIDGAMVKEVTPVSTAAAMGLRSGDVVFQFNDLAVHSFQDLVGAMEGKVVGDRVALKFRRDGKAMEAVGYLIPSSSLPLNLSMGMPLDLGRGEGPVRIERQEIRY
jgi:hypothetical protein